MLIFNKYFYKNKKSKLYFGDHVAVLNDFIYQTGGSIFLPTEASKAINKVNRSCVFACTQVAIYRVVASNVCVTFTGSILRVHVHNK
jgi:hypothetical protein